MIPPFHRIGIAARHAAFKNDTLKPDELERVVKQTQDRLVVWVQLRGAREDFARFYVPRLLAGGARSRRSSCRTSGRRSARTTGTTWPAASTVFRSKDLTGRDRLALVVADADGRDVTRFTIDLARMR